MKDLPSFIEMSFSLAQMREKFGFVSAVRGAAHAARLAVGNGVHGEQTGKPF